MMGGIEPMQVPTLDTLHTAHCTLHTAHCSLQVDVPEENDNEANGLEEAEEQSYTVDNPSLDLEAISNSYDGLAKLYRHLSSALNLISSNLINLI